MSAERDSGDLVRDLAAAVRSFGGDSSTRKLRLLAALGRGEGLDADALAEVRSALDFLRAYPDDAVVLRRAREAIRGLPPAPALSCSFSYGVVRRIVASAPERLEIDWDAIDDEGPLADLVALVVLEGESPAVVDPDLSLREWFRRCRPRRFATDLAWLVRLFERSDLSEAVRCHVYEDCAPPLLYAGPASCSVEVPAARTAFQRGPIARESFPLEPVIRSPLPTPTRAGREVVDAAVAALCARDLEIFALIGAENAGTCVVDGGRGLRIAFIGAAREHRTPWETLGTFIALKNAAPIAYGPVGVFAGCCEMGINLFPEFRGAEIRHLYAQFMRAVHRLYGVEYFFLTRYGMGEDNPEAIESGAFWFYRKLGLRPTNPKVEALARAEEERMRADPSHRSNRRTLLRLSRTEAFLDLSGGRRRPFPLGGLAAAETLFVERRFRGDRVRAERECARRAARLLGVDPDAWSTRILAPTLALIPDLAQWPRRDLAALADVVRAKGASPEMRYARLVARHARLEAALRAVAESSFPDR